MATLLHTTGPLTLLYTKPCRILTGMYVYAGVHPSLIHESKDKYIATPLHLNTGRAHVLTLSVKFYVVVGEVLTTIPTDMPASWGVYL